MFIAITCLGNELEFFPYLYNIDVKNYELLSQYWYWDIPSFVKMLFQLEKNGFYSKVSLLEDRAFSSYALRSNSNFSPYLSSFLKDKVIFATTSPFLAYLGYKNKSFDFRIGRWRENWGPERSGLVLSDAAPYRNGMKYSLKLDPLYFDYYFCQSISTSSMARSFAFHRIYYRKGGFDIGIVEGVSISPKSLDFTDFIPVLSFHNNFKKNTNVIAELYSSLKTIFGKVYFSYALDEIGGPGEGHKLTTDTVWSYAFSLGDIIDLKKGKLRLEYTHTTPFVYLSPDVEDDDFYYQILEYNNGWKNISFPMGFLYGGDVKNDLYSRYSYADENVGVDLKLEYMERGEYTNFSSFNDEILSNYDEKRKFEKDLISSGKFVLKQKNIDFQLSYHFIGSKDKLNLIGQAYQNGIYTGSYNDYCFLGFGAGIRIHF